MFACAPSPREVERLHGILDIYARDELWLRTRHCFRLPGQTDQVCFDVVDDDGHDLLDRSGRARSHTLQIYSPTVDLVPGLLVHLSRKGDAVAVRIEPESVDLLHEDRLADVSAPAVV